MNGKKWDTLTLRLKPKHVSQSIFTPKWKHNQTQIIYYPIMSWEKILSSGEGTLRVQLWQNCSKNNPWILGSFKATDSQRLVRPSLTLGGVFFFLFFYTTFWERGNLGMCSQFKRNTDTDMTCQRKIMWVPRIKTGDKFTTKDLNYSFWVTWIIMVI